MVACGNIILAHPVVTSKCPSYGRCNISGNLTITRHMLDYHILVTCTKFGRILYLQVRQRSGVAHNVLMYSVATNVQCGS